MTTAVRKTLTQAVEDEIQQGFVQNGCEFSAHSITVNLRFKVNDGDIEIEGRQCEDVDGVTTQRIEHDEVRDIVHSLCGTHSLSGYERVWNPLPQRGGYYSWAPIGSRQKGTPKPNAMNDILKPNPAKQSSITSSISSATSDQVRTCGQPVAIVKKVLSYVENRYKRGTPATLKTTQCRLKRTPLGIAQIAEIITRNGYQLKPAPPGVRFSSATLYPKGVKV